MDPRIPSVTVEVNGTAAHLLCKLMADLGTTDPMAALSRALGLLDQALAAKRSGRRLGLYDPTSKHFSDIVI
jgi:hypothetical protein